MIRAEDRESATDVNLQRSFLIGAGVSWDVLLRICYTIMFKKVTVFINFSFRKLQIK
jgi:hypothetical protein